MPGEVQEFDKSHKIVGLTIVPKQNPLRTGYLYLT
jgi:hypothetical protein